MFDRWADRLSKAFHYLFTPFAYPGRTASLTRLVFTNRPLVRELVHLTEHRRWFETSGFRTVIDVGGYIGAFSLAVQTILPEAQIYCFEPLPDNFETLVKNLSAGSHFHAFRSAIGAEKGELAFYRSSFAPSSSALPMGDLHKQAFPHTAETTRVSVPVARLDDFLEEMKLVAPVLLKLDVQGYEEQALLGATQVLRHVDAVLTEVSFKPLYEGQANFDRLNELMKCNGFVYAGGFESLFSPLDGSILQSDLLFVHRRNENPGGQA
jgi:FkbM family methyltransferase